MPRPLSIGAGWVSALKIMGALNYNPKVVIVMVSR